MCAMDRTSKVDIEGEVYSCGVKTAQLAEKVISGAMVSIVRTSYNAYKIELTIVPLEKVALKTKTMDDKYINRHCNFVIEEYIKYLKPLIGKISIFSEI